MVRVPAFQAGYAGSIPVTRSPRNPRLSWGFITSGTSSDRSKPVGVQLLRNHRRRGVVSERAESGGDSWLVVPEFGPHCSHGVSVRPPGVPAIRFHPHPLRQLLIRSSHGSQDERPRRQAAVHLGTRRPWEGSLYVTSFTGIPTEEPSLRVTRRALGVDVTMSAYLTYESRTCSDRPASTRG